MLWCGPKCHPTWTGINSRHFFQLLHKNDIFTISVLFWPQCGEKKSIKGNSIKGNHIFNCPFKIWLCEPPEIADLWYCHLAKATTISSTTYSTFKVTMTVLTGINHLLPLRVLKRLTKEEVFSSFPLQTKRRSTLHAKNITKITMFLWLQFRVEIFILLLEFVFSENLVFFKSVFYSLYNSFDWKIISGQPYQKTPVVQTLPQWSSRRSWIELNNFIDHLQ